MAAGTNVKVGVQNAVISPDEPNTIFTNTTTGLALVTINAADVASWPLLYTASWSSGTGSMILVALALNGGAKGGSHLHHARGRGGVARFLDRTAPTRGRKDHGRWGMSPKLR
jgi:hypothetical protein